MGITIASLVALAPAQAKEGCANTPSGWGKRIAGASDARLQAAYKNGTCWVIKPAHPGGYYPPCAGANHITVRFPGYTCHVFTKQSIKACQGGAFPSTCF